MYHKNRFFQKIAFNLAYDNLGLTFPNPSVAALLVKDGEIISKAVTSQNGGSHAEYLAIKNSGIRHTKVKYKAPTVVNLINIVSIYSAVLSPGLIPGM